MSDDTSVHGTVYARYRDRAPVLIAVASRYVSVAFPALVLLILAPILQLSFFSHPAADDFCFGTIENETLWTILSETFDSVTGVYHSWSGNYTSVATQRFIPALFDLTRWNAIIPLGLLILTFSGLLALLKSAFGGSRITLPMVILATTGTAVFVVSMPDITPGLYWFSAANNYHAGSVMLLFVLALLVRLVSFEKTVNVLSPLFIGLVLLLVVTAGIHVMTLISLLAITFALATREFLLGGNQRYPLLLLLILVVILAGITVSAPGNYERAQNFPGRGQFWFSVSGAVFWGTRSIAKWAGNPLLWVSTAIALICFSMLPAQQVNKFRPNRYFLWLFPAIACGYILVMHFPHLWATGIKPSGRVSNVIYFIFLLLWFWYVFIIFRGLLAFGRPALSVTRFRPAFSLVSTLLLAVFSLMLYTTPSMSEARLDLVGRAHDYHATYLVRYRILLENKGSDVSPVEIPDFARTVPDTIFFADISSSPDHWRNQCMAHYFGVESVITVD